MSIERTAGRLALVDGFIMAGAESLPLIGVQIPRVAGAKRLEACANAAFLVRAWNAHDALVEALRTARIQLVALGGDILADDIQRAVLTVIDAALHASEPTP